MVFLINLTGLNKIYWLPKIRRESDAVCGIWYFDVRFLFCQMSVFNKTLGKKLIVAMNDKHTWLPE